MRPVFLGLFSLCLCTVTVPSFAAEVEITLVDELDGKQNSYCLDIKGGGRNIDPANGLQSHTCYSYRGELGRDQIFETENLSKNQFYMPRFDVCVELSSLSNGASMNLASCDGSENQQISLMDDGTIRPVAASDLCFTVATETSLGRNPIHQIKGLTLEPCNQDIAERQTWRTRIEDD